MPSRCALAGSWVRSRGDRTPTRNTNVMCAAQSISSLTPAPNTCPNGPHLEKPAPAAQQKDKKFPSSEEIS